MRAIFGCEKLYSLPRKHNIYFTFFGISGDELMLLVFWHPPATAADDVGV